MYFVKFLVYHAIHMERLIHYVWQTHNPSSTIKQQPHNGSQRITRNKWVLTMDVANATGSQEGLCKQTFLQGKFKQRLQTFNPKQRFVTNKNYNKACCPRGWTFEPERVSRTRPHVLGNSPVPIVSDMKFQCTWYNCLLR